MAATAPAPGRERLELEDIQRLLIQGYSRQPNACYALLKVTDRVQAKTWLAAQIPRVGTARPDERAADRTRPDSRLAVAFTWPGLRALGFPDDDPEFEGFVGEFREGMVADHRSRILGDTGRNAPDAWEWGGPKNDEIHVLLMVFAVSVEQLRADWDALHAGLKGLSLVTRICAYLHKEGREHFGFRDGISQPYIEGSDTHLRPSGRHAAAATVKAGEFVLGHANEFGVRPASPSVARELDPGNPPSLRPHPEAPAQRLDFGRNGTYLVLRQLQQDVQGFAQFVNEKAGKLKIDPELLAAKLMGRWKSGAPLVLAPNGDDHSLETENGFGFFEEDRHGLRCPLGAHIRRANPRDSLADPSLGVTPEASSLLANRHRLIRRGRLYEKEDGEKGILFLALNANLQRQFEFVQQHWINGDKFGGLLDERDPTVGTMPEGKNRMTLQGCPVSRRIEDIDPFVKVRGGAYFFMPGLRALGFLALPENASPPARPRFGEVREFRPRRFWAQADLQTLRRELQARLGIGPPLAKLSARREERSFPMPDGTRDVLLASYDHPARDAGRKPLVLVIHGLPGSEQSAVVVHTAAALLRCGYPVLRLNLRGARPSRKQTQQLYHAGRSQDLHHVLAGLSPEFDEQGVVLVAYSLGANMLLKALGEGVPHSVRGAVSISAPLDLAEMAKHLLGLRGLRQLIYVQYLLWQTKQQVKKVKGLKPKDRAAIDSARNFYQFDERFLARFSGFDGADDYYAKSSSGQFLADIQVPTLLIHAPNDPIVPIDAYHRFDWKSNPKLCPLLAAAGGHAGFHGRGSPVAWHDRVLRVFLEQLEAS